MLHIIVLVWSDGTAGMGHHAHEDFRNRDYFENYIVGLAEQLAAEVRVDVMDAP